MHDMSLYTVTGLLSPRPGPTPPSLYRNPFISPTPAYVEGHRFPRQPGGDADKAMFMRRMLRLRCLHTSSAHRQEEWI